MDLFGWLRRLYPPPVSESFLRKYEPPYFKDTDIQKELAQNGFAVRSLLTQEDMQHLKEDFKEILLHPNNEITGLFWNSGRAKDTYVRNMAKKSIDKYVKPKLENFFFPDTVDLMGGVFVAKPLGEESGLNPHQDSSHVEEDRFLSVYAWCTLTDVTVENGALHVIPGSHKFGNSQRSLNIPWQFEPFYDILKKYSVPIPMKAGQVLFFDSAAIHSSSPNLGIELRLAVNFFIKPRLAQFLHYYQDEKTPEGMIEKFCVDMDFYYNKDFESRPGKMYPLLGMEPRINLKLNRKKLEYWCQLDSNIK